MTRLTAIHWRSNTFWQGLNLNTISKNWLLDTSSLTSKIRHHCPQMRVEVLSEKWQRPLSYEIKTLGLKQGEFAWVRCVLLKCDRENWVYARSVIPNMRSGNPWFALKKLGNKPLGEVLFNLKQIKRTPFLLSKTSQAWPYLPCQKTRLARQSIFTQKGYNLLLTEVFLQNPIYYKRPLHEWGAS